MFAKKREEVSETYAGEIVAIPDLRLTGTGDSLCDSKHPIVYEKIVFAEPVINQSIEARTLADQEKMLDALAKLSEEDPTFKFRNDEESGQIIISGVGELHLEIMLDRLNREFRIPARVGKPQVAYRETITDIVTQEGRFEKQLNGKNLFGVVNIEMSPSESGKGNIVLSALPDKKIPDPILRDIMRIARETMQVGQSGYPLIDVTVVIKNVEYDETNPNDVGYKNAVGIAIKEALKKANIILLEPVFEIEIVSPEDYVGDIISDLNARHGRIEGINQVGLMQEVKGSAPLSEMFGYVTKLRSLSQGRASYTMTFSHYEPAIKQNTY
jgi:elongation factor G